MTRYRISAVSYLNTKPFLFGLEACGLVSEHDLVLDTPAECARKLRAGEADIGLVPVAALPTLPHARVVTEFCIGGDGAVGSVLLLSGVPLGRIGSVYLDYQSLTSVALVRILAERHWRIAPEWLAAEAGYEERIGGSTAGVVIGDRALAMRDQFPYAYDLSVEWRAMTGLPFVFACWAAGRPLDTAFLHRFEAALRYGADHRSEAVRKAAPGADAEAYIAGLKLEMDGRMREGMNLFLEYAAALQDPALSPI